MALSKTNIMQLKKHTLFFFITITSISIYAQEGNNNEVWVEDQGVNKEFKENDDKYRALEKEFDEMMKQFMKFYSDLRTNGFSKVAGSFSKEKLGVFISEAEKYKNNITNNAQVNSLNNQLNNLAKVTSRSPQDRVGRLNSMGQAVERDIASAKTIIADIERNESKKEVSISFGNTSSSSSNTNNTNSTTDSNISTGNSQSNTSTKSSMSASDLHYKNALERERVYQEGMQTAANQLVDVGVSIVNDIQQARVRNVAEKNRYIREYLSEMIPLDKECADLYANNNYGAFLIKEKELRKYENYVIDHLNWLIDKEGDSNYKNLKNEVSSNQRKRLKLILEYNTNLLLTISKKTKNNEFILKFHNFYINEIKDFISELSDENGFYYSPEGGYQTYRSWVDFIEEERKVRTRKILELNKTNNFLTPVYEVILYVFSNYYDSYYDNKVFNIFLKANKADKKRILYYAVNTRHMVDFDEHEDRQLRLLLGDGSEQVYYYTIEVQTKRKTEKIPLYQYLNDADNDFKKTTANKLVKEWIKRDEKLSGKKAKEIYEEFSKASELPLNSILNEIKSLYEKGDYDKAQLLVEKSRIEHPNNFNLLMNEANIYLKKGNATKYLELLKEGTILKPNEPDLLYNIGVLEAQTGNNEEAIFYYKKVISIKPDYYNALLNIGIIAQETENTEEAIIYYQKALHLDPLNYQLNFILGEIYLSEVNKKTKEANEILKTKKNPDKFKEIFLKRYELLKSSLACYKTALSIDDSDDGVKEQIPLLQAKIEQANSILAKMN